MPDRLMSAPICAWSGVGQSPAGTDGNRDVGDAYILLECCCTLPTNKGIIVWCSNGKLDVNLEHEREHDIGVVVGSNCFRI